MQLLSSHHPQATKMWHIEINSQVEAVANKLQQFITLQPLLTDCFTNTEMFAVATSSSEQKSFRGRQQQLPKRQQISKQRLQFDELFVVYCDNESVSVAQRQCLYARWY